MVSLAVEGNNNNNNNNSNNHRLAAVYSGLPHSSNLNSQRSRVSGGIIHWVVSHSRDSNLNWDKALRSSRGLVFGRQDVL